MPDLNLQDKETDRIARVLAELAAHYPQVGTSLVYGNPYELLVATVLSAQTTDEQVNKITAALFRVAPAVEDLARMSPADLEPYLRSCGLYRHKSRYLAEAAKIIVERHGGKVPSGLEQLRALPGVGRKTANIIVSEAFGQPAIAVDTHVFRVSRRLGLARGLSVEVVEEELREAVPRELWRDTHHRLITHGRTLCRARGPLCGSCFLQDRCLFGGTVKPEKGELKQ